MDVMVFRSFCAQVARLSVGELRDLRGRRAAIAARVAARARIDARRAALTRCRHCGGERLQRWGETRTGLQRLRCTACRRTFSSATGTAFHGLRLPEKFQLALADMLSTAPGSCRALAARLSVDKTTVWRWRMRVLAALAGAGPALGGIVEADTPLLRESRKGSREWVNHRRNPQAFPRPDRPRWQDWRRLGHRPPDLRRYQMPVLLLTDRAGGRRAEMLPDRRGASLAAALARHVAPDAVLCSGAGAAYAAGARPGRLPHVRLDTGTGPLAAAFHLRTVTALHARFAAFLRPFCGPATRNLPCYLGWFIAREQGAAADAELLAWRLLAA